MSKLPRHPLVLAVKPIIEALGATLVPAEEREKGDLPLRWEGELVAAVRPAALHGALDRLIEAVEREMGAPLPTLSREDKQKAIRLLDDRGAFILRLVQHPPVERQPGQLAVQIPFRGFEIDRRFRRRSGRFANRRLVRLAPADTGFRLVCDRGTVATLG